MKMDRTTKTAIKKLVLTLRKLLEEDIEVVLKRYGLFTDRAWLPEGEIPRADDEILAARRRMEAAIGVERARGLEPGEATGWYIREVAFTYLNRLVGLKCLEVRGLIEEVITARVKYTGRSLFHRDFRHAHPQLAAQPDDALPAALEAACRHVTDEMIGVLFDPDSESSVIWPRYQTLRQAIALINELPAEVWTEDEIIGWVYQFYNAEEKERIRKRGRPQLPIEVAVINQFFTPRWVVKFLVDNTLGRLWLEMHPESAGVRAKCDYLVPEPLPIADSRLSIDEEQPTPENRKSEIETPKSFQLDPDSPVNNPEAAPRRDPKPVTEIRLIDPACGTMHFGYYAFEVFQEMYRDARECGWPVWGSSDSANEPVSEHPADVEIPALILRHNLYGVDIDLRAVQLAALSLFMKARLAESEALRQQGVAHHASRNTYHVSLVCADARLTDGEVRARFLKEYADDPALQRVWRELFREMEDIAQVGSLLRVEERFRQLLQEYRPASVSLDSDRQLELSGVPQGPRQMGLAEVPGGETWNPRRTLAQMLDHLRRFARDALEEADVNAELFASETEKTLGLLDVLLQDYDVVVMNPPYGDTTGAAKKRLKQLHPRTWNDLYAAFLERSVALVMGVRGFVGALTSRTFMSLPTYRSLREDVVLKFAHPIVLLDLGFEVLDDAVVDTAATVLSCMESSPIARFIRLEQFASDRKEAGFVSALREDVTYDYQPGIRDFAVLPNSPFSYWASRDLVSVVRNLTALDSEQTSSREAIKIADVKDGLSAGGSDKFVRHFWECAPGTVGQGNRWVPFAKGGGFCRFYSDIYLALNWDNGGLDVRSAPRSYVKNEQFYYREGITYPNVTVKGYSARYLPAGTIFSTVGQGVFPGERKWIYPILGFLNSELAEGLLKVIGVKRHYNVGFVAHLPIAQGVLDGARGLGDLAHRAHDLKSSWDTANEICTRFSQPWLLQLARSQSDAFAQGLGRVLELLGDAGPSLPGSASPSLKDLLDQVREIETAADARLQGLQAQIDETVYDLYEIMPEDRALIERELRDRPPELVWPQMEGKSDQEKRREHVRRLLSYFILQALKADQDGILPLVEGTGELTLLERLRQRLEAAFGADIAFQLEDHAGQVLGKSVDRWLEGDFIQWHTKLYKRRPVIWHVASPRRAFGALIFYHQLDRDTLRKVRNVYLRALRDGLGRGLEQARSDEDYKAVDRLETALDDLRVLDERLAGVIEAGYDPVIDDGVKANILPLQEAEVLRQKKVV